MGVLVIRLTTIASKLPLQKLTSLCHSNFTPADRNMLEAFAAAVSTPPCLPSSRQITSFRLSDLLAAHALPASIAAIVIIAEVFIVPCLSLR